MYATHNNRYVSQRRLVVKAIEVRGGSISQSAMTAIGMIWWTCVLTHGNAVSTSVLLRRSAKTTRVTVMYTTAAPRTSSQTGVGAVRHQATPIRKTATAIRLLWIVK